MKSKILLLGLSVFALRLNAQTLQNVTDNGSTTSNTISINTGNEGISLIGNSYLSFRNAGTQSRTGYLQHDGSNLVINADAGNVRFMNNVGIGVLNPSYKLDVSGEARVATTVITNSNAPFSSSSVLFSSSGFHNMFGVDGTWTSKYFGMKTDGTFVAMGGNVGIGTTSPNSKLAVNGNIRAHEIKVETANWPDYVFAKDYLLPTLQETEKHIKEKGHLPGIPSASEVKANGVDLGEMNAKLLQKIEELTLHLIEKEKLVSDLSIRVKKLEEKN
ncbi:hypothetical protein [Pedobacter africanus]|uniref:BZIP transcription factor n=1 Tax=Pedobacter africanus TaxID=151894 RepID=A0A1W2BQQ4_9SPHI|nr:hypothetical protein [Pedobacter africanus]SMC75191.1 hypothetical protein SAMN04488524_2559 [Pedobacter africanus]